MKVNSTASASATGGSGESSDPVVDAAQVQPLADFTVAALIAALPSPTAVFAADAPRFTVLAASDALLATSNRPREAVVGRPLAQAFPNASPEDPAATGLADLRGSLEAAVRTGALQRMPRQRYDLERADGVWEERYWDAMNTPVPGPDGAVRYVLHQTEDVTTRVRSEQAALRSELRAARILEQVSDAHCTLDREFRIVSVNAAAERALGLPRDALLGRTHWDVFPASVDSDAGRAYRRVVAGGGDQRVTQHYVGEGYDRHLEIDAYPTDEGGVAIFWRDVTERLHAEAALRASEERLRLVVAATGLGVFDWDLTTDRVTVNARFRELLGLPEGEAVMGAAMLGDVVHPEDRALVEARLAAAFDPRSSGAYGFEHRAVTPAGEVWLLTFGQVFFAGEGAERRAVRVIGNDLDITERKQAEAERELAHQQLQDQATELELQAEALQATAVELEERTEDAERARQLAEAERARAAGILEAMADAYFALDAEFRIVAVNAAMARATGLARDALLGRVFWEVFPGTVGTAYERHYRAAATQGTPAHFTDAYDDGRLALVSEADVYPVAGGGVAVFWRDITARVQAEAALRESEQRFRLMADAVPQIVWITDPDGRVEFFNQHWADYTGVPYEPTTAAAVAAGFVHPDDGPATVAAFDAARRGGGTFAVEHRIRSAAGDYRWFLVRAEPYRDPATGAIARWFGASVDIHDRKQAEAERERARAEAEAARSVAEAARSAAEAAQDRAEHARQEAAAANQVKSAFLATMSHELRTPVNAVLGYAQLLDLGLAGPVTEQQHDYLERLARSGHHLLGLVNDVLDLSKIEAGETRVARTDGMTGPAVGAAFDLVAPAAAARGVRLVDARADEAGVPFVGDEDRVRQIVVNLLSNAVKFTAPGGAVTVTCDTVRAAPPAATHLRGEGPWALVRVADTGVGIAPEDQGRIFDAFHQVEQGHTRAAGGTGLGLAISRRLARLMGGDLSVESAPGVGSVFTLWLPAARQGAGHPDETAAERSVRAERELTRLETPGLGEVGALLHEAVTEVIGAYTDRLRADPAVPHGAAMTRVQLEDHAISFLADLAQSLVIVEDAGPEAVELLQDGSAIQRAIAEAHGARRHAQGWDEDALRRDQQVFREEVERAVRARLKAGSGDVDEAVRVLLQLIDRGQGIAVRAWRRAAQHETT